ncbi:MAG TPA: hypothetical protein VGM34_03140 [Chlamydiales bacterium]|jgi:hypothetical protein
MTTINQSGNSELIQRFSHLFDDDLITATEQLPPKDRITVLESRTQKEAERAEGFSANLIREIQSELEKSQKTRWGWIAYKLNSDTPILRKIASALSWFLSKIFSLFELESQKQDTLLQMEKALLSQYTDKKFKISKEGNATLALVNSSIGKPIYLDLIFPGLFFAIVTKREEVTRYAQALSKIRKTQKSLAQSAS